jgi:hypothetical protein
VLIRRMSEENPLWGAPRIHGDLLKLGFAVSQSTITKYVARTSNPPSQSWRTCVRNHAPQIGNAASRQLFFGSPLAPPGYHVGLHEIVSHRSITATAPTVDAGSGRQRNADVSSEMRVATPTSEQYGVFRAYLDARNPDGGMADMTLLDYAMMIEDSYVYTCMVEYRRRCPENGSGRRGDLLAVAFTDVLNDGISMVYSFFQPEEGRRSLGTLMILDHIARARGWGSATSISVTGCAARAKWTTRPVSCRRSDSDRTVGAGSTARRVASRDSKRARVGGRAHPAPAPAFCRASANR